MFCQVGTLPWSRTEALRYDGCVSAACDRFNVSFRFRDAGLVNGVRSAHVILSAESEASANIVKGYIRSFLAS